MHKLLRAKRGMQGSSCNDHLQALMVSWVTCPMAVHAWKVSEAGRRSCVPDALMMRMVMTIAAVVSEGPSFRVSFPQASQHLQRSWADLLGGALPEAEFDPPPPRFIQAYKAF